MPNNNNEIKPDKPASYPIPNTKGNDIIFGDPYKVPSKTPLKNIISNWPYEEIESKICSQIIFQNHILLNETINNISDYLINELDLKIIVNISKISYSPPDYLINPTTNTLKILKSDIELYKNIYQRLSIDIYNFTLKKYEILNNIYSSLNDIKEDFIYLLYQFKENVKNISIPFILEREGLLNKTELNKNISLFDEIEKYKNEINNLNDLYNIFFKYINNEIQIIVDEINIIKNYTLDLQRKIEEQKEIFIKKLEEFNIARDNLEYHEILIQIKNTIISIREEINKKKIKLKEIINLFEIQSKKIDLEELKKSSDDIIEKINTLFISIEKGINYKRRLNSNQNSLDELYASNIISNSIIYSLKKKIKKSQDMFVISKDEEEEKEEEYDSLYDIEDNTSLDLLFIMDTSGSMIPYVSQAKANIINIIDRITLENVGINVSAGLIGYSDINTLANYTNIDFTQNHSELKNKLLKIYPYNGGYDTPEDMAWGFEMALNKSWKSNSRVIILVADSPCHGKKYHTLEDDYPNGIQSRKNIEESLEVLAKNNTSLYCIRITEFTDKMFKIFENIYKNYTKCNFTVVNMNNIADLSEIVVNASTNTYINQRYIE